MFAPETGIDGGGDEDGGLQEATCGRPRPIPDDVNGLREGMELVTG